MKVYTSAELQSAEVNISIDERDPLYPNGYSGVTSRRYLRQLSSGCQATSEQGASFSKTLS